MKRYIRKYLNKQDQKRYRDYINRVLKDADFSKIINRSPEKINTITFVVPGMMAYSGGHTSILRLGTNLNKKGYEVRYISYYEQNVEEMKKNALINLKDYEGEIISTQELFTIESDLVIATYWESLYIAKKMSGYKMYFIQDYEPYFNVYGELFLLTQKTYELGAHMVSLGDWNKKVIEKFCAPISNIDKITFPYEAKEYYPIERNYIDYANKREFNIAVFIKNTGKRAPYLIQNILCNLKEKFKKDNITINIKYFGESKEFECEGGENLGKLSKEQMLKLYHESDFGLVASLTNISLVPYEMIATGLPIIEFEEGTFNYFFPRGCAIITSFDYNDLYTKLTNLINQPEMLKNYNDNANNYIKKLSWEKTTEEFVEIIKKIELVGSKNE